MGFLALPMVINLARNLLVQFLLEFLVDKRMQVRTVAEINPNNLSCYNVDP